MFVCHNGQFIPEEEAKISVYNKAAFFDFGVYESIKVLKGQAFLPEQHVARLFNSAKQIDLDLGYTAKEVLNWIQGLIKNNQHENAYLRLLAYGQTENDQQVELFIFPLGLTFYPRKLFKTGVKVITYQGERLLPQVKSMNLLVGFLALRAAKKANALEALLVDCQGRITEGTRSNFFAVKNGIIIAPPKERVLAGVTLELLQKLIKQAGLNYREEDISLAQLGSYAEVFITSTGMGVMPVNQVDEQKFPVGETTKKVQRLLKEFEHQYFSETLNSPKGIP